MGAIRAENYGLEEYPDGWGTLTYNRGDALKREKFEGFLEKGIINGYGTMWWTDGSKFTGQWINNTKSGWGTMFYANGDIFSGSWTDEKKDEGKYMFATGGDVSGKFESGKISGNVKNVNIAYSENLQDVFTGEIVSGARTTGTYTHSNGDIYEGNFEIDKGSYDAVGKYIWACGKIYEGTFKDGKPNGFGKMVYSKGDSEEWTYEGEFKDGKFEGNGKFTWSENNYYEGQFSNGQMTGVEFIEQKRADCLMLQLVSTILMPMIKLFTMRLTLMVKFCVSKKLSQAILSSNNIEKKNLFVPYERINLA